MSELRRHIMMQQGGGSVLPPEYQQVEWIQCTGTQGLLLPGISSFLLKVEDLENLNYYTVLGQYLPSANILIWVDGGRIKIGSWGQHGVALTAGQHTFEYNYSQQDVVVIDGVPSQGGHTSWNNRYQTRLFLSTQTGNGYGKIVYLKSINTDMELYPCYRKADNEAGMYDIVNDVFYTNAGSGSFIVGPNV